MGWQEYRDSKGYVYYAGESPNPQRRIQLWQWVLKDGIWKGFSRLDPDVFRVKVKS